MHTVPSNSLEHVCQLIIFRVTSLAEQTSVFLLIIVRRDLVSAGILLESVDFSIIVLQALESLNVSDEKLV